MKHSDIDHSGLTGVGASDAADVAITDAGAYFTGTDVEAALQELGAGGGGGGGVTQAYLGYNTVGASFEAMTANRHYIKKVTIASACFIASVDIYVKGNGGNVLDLATFILGDSAGTPTEMVSASKAGPQNGNNQYFWNTTGRWFSGAHSIYLPAADYWFGFAGNGGALSIAYDAGSDRYYAAGGAYLEDYSLVGSSTDSTRKYSLRLNTFS